MHTWYQSDAIGISIKCTYTYVVPARCHRPINLIYVSGTSAMRQAYNNLEVKGKVFYVYWRIYYHRMRVQLSTTCSNVLKQPNGELLVALNHNQLRTMASETVDPIDWSHPPPSWAVPPEPRTPRAEYKSVQPQRDSNVQSQQARQPPCLCGHSGYN